MYNVQSDTFYKRWIGTTNIMYQQNPIKFMTKLFLIIVQYSITSRHKVMKVTWQRQKLKWLRFVIKDTYICI